MKKSKLKYLIVLMVSVTIFGLYQSNKQYFESAETTSQRIARDSNYGTGSFGGADFSGSGGGGGFSQGSSESNIESSNSNISSSGFHSPSFSGAASTYQKERSEETDYATTNLVPDIASNSGAGNSSGGVANSGGNLSIGIPFLSTDDSDKEDQKKEEVSKNTIASQTAGRDKFFSDKIEMPMAPLPPDQEIPLDGGASILLALGSIIGVKKLMGKRKTLF